MTDLRCYRCRTWPCCCEDGQTIICGDARSIVPLLSFDIVLTDPPYGINGGRGGDRSFGKAAYSSDQWEDTPEYIRDAIAPVVSDVVSRASRSAVTPGLRCWREYPKESGAGCFWLPAAVTHGPWGFTCFTPILFYGRDPRSGIGQLPSGITVTEASEKNGHPCPKPIVAWTWLLNKLGPEPHETVLDPFAGSGTTLVAAKKLGCRCIGIEINETYVQIACRRLQQKVLAFPDDVPA